MTGQSWPRHLPTGLSQLGACGHSQSRYRRSQASWHKPETRRFMLQSPWERGWRSLLERIILAHRSKESNMFHRQIKYNTDYYKSKPKHKISDWGVWLEQGIYYEGGGERDSQVHHINKGTLHMRRSGVPRNLHLYWHVLRLTGNKSGLWFIRIWLLGGIAHSVTA